jgi:hypothetical protein
MAPYTRATLVKDLTHLMRLPTGDKLSLRAFFDEAQGVLRRAREAGVEVPPAAVQWITSAEQRAANPVASAAATAALIEALHRLEAS